MRTTQLFEQRRNVADLSHVGRILSEAVCIRGEPAALLLARRLFRPGLRDPESSHDRGRPFAEPARECRLVGGAVIVINWLATGRGSLGQGELALVAATGVVAGVQIFFTSFLLSILGLRRPLS